MNKTYGICMVDCEVFNDVGIKEELKITTLVQIVYENHENKHYTIKILGDRGLSTINNNVYQCEWQYVTVVVHELIQYLATSDYWGRLDILRFKKKILSLKSGSKGKLQVLYNNCRRFINFDVVHIGPFSQHGEGYFVMIKFSEDVYRDIDVLRALISTLGKNGYFILRVEQLFSEIELSEPLCNNEQLNSQPNALSFNQNTSNYFGYPSNDGIPTNTNDYNDQNKNVRTRNTENVSDITTNVSLKYELTTNKFQNEMDVDNNNSYESNKSLAYHQEYYKFRNSDVAKLGTNNTKMCMGCDKLENLFTFPCAHPFCYKCILQRLDYIRHESKTRCPNCYSDLLYFQEKRFSEFLEQTLGEEDEFKSKSYDYSLQKTSPQSNELLRGSNNENLGQKAKMCLLCKQLENLFTFPCADVFCYTCILKLLDMVKQGSSTKCPNCETILEDEMLKLLNDFINHNISKEETPSKTNDKDTPKKVSKNDTKFWFSNKERKNESADKEKKGSSGGNKTESRFCKQCHTSNKYSATSCKSCRRPLSASDYSYTKS